MADGRSRFPRTSGFGAALQQLRKNFPDASGRLERVMFPAEGASPLGGAVALPLAAGRGISQIVRQPLTTAAGIPTAVPRAIDALAASPTGQAIGASMEQGQVNLLPGAESEMARVQQALNPDYRGVLVNAAPAAATAVGTAGANLARTAVGQPPVIPGAITAPSVETAAPAAPAAPTGAPAPGFEEFAARNQGLRPGGRGAPVISGPRIIRRPGENPILTNMASEPLDFAMSGRSATAPFAQGDLTGGVSFRGADGTVRTAADIAPEGQGLRPRARTEQEQVLQGIEGKDYSFGSRRSSGRGWLAGMTDVALGAAESRATGRREAREFDQGVQLEELGLRGRETAAKELAARGTAAGAQQDAAKTQAEIKKINAELGVNLEPYYAEVTDPTTLETTKTFAGFVAKGGTSAARIPSAAADAYYRNLAAAKPEEKEAITRAFKSRYGLGG